MRASGSALDTDGTMHRGWKAPIVPLLAGAMTFGVTQWWLFTTSSGSGTSDPGWFLNGRDAGLAMTTAIACVSAILSAFRRAHWLAGAAAFTIGAVAALTFTLFSIGPGTIFPLVIVFGTIVVAGAALIGGGLGWLLRWAWTGRPH